MLFSSGFFHIFGSSVLNKIISFASGIVLVRILEVSEYGVYTYANNIFSFVVLFSGFGMSSSILQLCSESKDDEEKCKEIYTFGSRLGIIFNFILVGIIAFISFFIPLPIVGSNSLLLFMCLLPIVNLIVELQRCLLRYEMRNREYSYSNTFSAIVFFILSCALSFLFRTNGLIIAYYLTAITSILLLTLRFNVPISTKKIRLAKNLKKDIIKLGGISVINSGLSNLMYLLDILILGIIIQDETVIATYKIATYIPTALIFIPTAIVIYIYPYFAQHRNESAWLLQNYKRLIIATGSFNLVISIILLVFADPIISITFGEEYLAAVDSFRILCVSYAISGTFRIISGNLLVTQRKLIFNLIIATSSSAINTVLNIIMITEWGLIGAAGATIITVILTSFASTIYLLYVFKNARDTVITQ
jgi:O-antigen/teichoic acid export membrane protein